MTQWLIVIVAVALSVAYLLYRLWKALTSVNDPCQGCDGCALRDEMRSRRRSAFLQNHKKKPCEKKNKPKNLVVL